ncbi:MAG: EF-hand domain-containing protein [Rhodobacteraceae bacterium]|nr:EF-hand domain-containing protein [Paracoccaceae bacterium]
MKTKTISALFAATLLVPGFAMATSDAETIEQWDLNSDGVVSLAEVTTRLQTSFNEFDTNGDGYLDAADEVAGSEDIGAETAEVTVEFGDIDADDRVSQAEFLGRAQEWLTAMDRNEDGSVTALDFGG